MRTSAEAREEMIQRHETERQTEARHFREEQAAFRAKLMYKNHAQQRGDSIDASTKDERIIQAVKADLARAGYTEKAGRSYRQDSGGVSEASRARQRMIDRMNHG